MLILFIFRTNENVLPEVFIVLIIPCSLAPPAATCYICLGQFYVPVMMVKTPRS